MGSGSTLSVCIQTRNSESRLPALLEVVAGFADEIVVGVDAASTDRTLAVATEGADVVFRFEAHGSIGPARMLVLDNASCEWVLLLDDDEGLEQRLVELLPDLTADPSYTHFWFTRKWLVERDPARYLRALPWFPDWQLRLFRNDRRLVWHSGRPHENHTVMGPGAHEDRGAVLHYERLQLTEEGRRRKIEGRLGFAGGDRFADFYVPADDVPTRVVEGGVAAPTGATRPPRRREVRGEVQSLDRPQSRPRWQASLEGEMRREFEAGMRAIVELRAINTGELRWEPASGDWPRLFLSYHLLDADGRTVIWDGERTPIPRILDPGDATTFLAMFVAPVHPGRFTVRWDLVSEGECWFEEIGSQPLELELEVHGNSPARKATGLRKRLPGGRRRAEEGD